MILSSQLKISAKTSTILFKQEHTFIIITGGSDSGKMRAAFEIGHALRTVRH